MTAGCCWLATAGCGGDTSLFGEGPGGTGGVTTTTSGTGGTGGTTSSSGSGGESPCEADCSLIEALPCQTGVCNAQTGQCELANDDDGEPCDDGLYCTVDTVCGDGVCKGGTAYNCGWTPGECDIVTCDETSKTCSLTQKSNGDPCVSDDLCEVNATCTNGSCNGEPKDCFFFPVPDECHVPECNPQDGQCVAVAGNQGQPCNDPNDLCTVNQTCNAGLCQGGQPIDCSYLDQDCLEGACNVNTGQCTTQPVPNGSTCSDLNPCTAGETCQNGTCTGGSAVTQCQGGDYCCPSGCTVSNDADCAIVELDIGAHDSVFTNVNSPRGYFFQAPTTMTIYGLRVPTAAGTAVQNVQVVRFNNGPPANYPTGTSNFVTLAYHNQVPGAGWIPVSISVQAGQTIGVIGARGTTTMSNSYGATNTYSSTIFGQSTTLYRLIATNNLSVAQATTLYGHTQNPYGRIELQYGP